MLIFHYIFARELVRALLLSNGVSFSLFPSITLVIKTGYKTAREGRGNISKDLFKELQHECSHELVGSN